MSQKPIMESSNGLKPPLVAALASLEVNLEQELSRYRRTRIGVRANSQSRVSSHSQNYPHDSKANTQPSLLEVKPQKKPLPLAPTDQDKPAPVVIKSFTEDKKPQLETENGSSLSPTNALEEFYTYPNQLPPPLPQNPGAALFHKSLVPKTSDNAQTHNKSETNRQIPLPPANSTENSSIVRAIAKNDHSEKLADNIPAQPDDYLESSEALLRSLTDEPSEDNVANNPSDSLLSPLGIGSMLLLLVASLTLGYVVFNPNTLPLFNFTRLFNGDSPNTQTPTGVSNNTQTQAQPELTPIPKYPNLAAREFPEVRNPIDVVGLQPKVQPTAIAPANPITIQAPISPPVTNPLPGGQRLPGLNTPSSNTQPSPQATTTPVQPIEQIKPSADGLYHIVTENQETNTLSTVRRVVADAYLSPNGKLIYLGIAKTKAEAQQRLKQLQAQGIKARVEQL